MIELGDDTVIRHAGHAISREINGEVVLLTPEDSKVHVLDEVGSRIWDLCAGGPSIALLVEEITTEYDVAPQEAQRDIIEFVGQLLDLGVVQADSGVARDAG